MMNVYKKDIASVKHGNVLITFLDMKLH